MGTSTTNSSKYFSGTAIGLEYQPFLFLVAFVLTISVVSGCATDPRRAAWFDEFQLANRGGAEAVIRVAAFDDLARRAPTVVDGCLARAEAATRASAEGLSDAGPRNQQLLEQGACRDHHPEAHYRLLELAVLEGGVSPNEDHFERLVEDHPDSLWARQGFELLWRMRTSGSEAALGRRYVSWYQRLQETSLAGHCLYFGALALLADPDSRSEAAEDTRLALHLLLLLFEHHSDSVRWDDGVLLAADLLAELGYRGDETRLLEAALLPHPSRGYDTLLGGFSARLRLRLANLYRRQGKHREALYQLSLVVNAHDSLRLKDDALWRSARIYATLGRSDAERRTLMFLVEHCPWSRHLAAARERLAGAEEQ